MAVFEIRDESTEEFRLLGYLFYYSRSKRFFAELLQEYDEWTAPFIFSGFVRKGNYSIDSIWSRKFVDQRIIPPDRQNLGSILKENGLREYDPYRLLCLSEGRCAQDELHLMKIEKEDMIPEIRKRLCRKVRDVAVLNDRRVLVFFCDGKTVSADCRKLCGDNRSFDRILAENGAFENVRVAPGGNGIEWGEERNIPAEVLYSAGKRLNLSYEDFLRFSQIRLVDTGAAAEMLNCTRQYINQLVREGRLTPVRSESNNNLFLKSDIESENGSL